MTIASMPFRADGRTRAPNFLQSRLAIAEVHTAFLWLLFRSLLPAQPQGSSPTPADRGWLDSVLSLVLIAFDVD